MVEIGAEIPRPIKKIDSTPPHTRPPLKQLPPFDIDPLPTPVGLRHIPVTDNPRDSIRTLARVGNRKLNQALWKRMQDRVNSYFKGGKADEPPEQIGVLGKLRKYFEKRKLIKPKKPNYPLRQGVVAAAGVLAATGVSVAAPDIYQALRRDVGRESVADVQRQNEHKFDVGSTVQIVTGEIVYKPDEGDTVKLWTLPSTERLEPEDAVGTVAKEIPHGQTLVLKNPVVLGNKWFPVPVDGTIYYVRVPSDYETNVFRKQHPSQERTVVAVDSITGQIETEAKRIITTSGAEILVNYSKQPMPATT